MTLLLSPSSIWLCGSQIPQQSMEIAASERNSNRSVDPKVELYSTRNSRAALSSVAKIPGREGSHTTRYSAIRKRAYRRARRRAEQHGGTYCRGRWMSAAALGTKCSADLPHKVVFVPPKAFQTSVKRNERLRVRCYNLGGINGPVYDHLHFWLTTECRDDIVMLQELHWGCGHTEATWTVQGWSPVVSVDPLQSYAGVGVLISGRVTSPDNISFTSCLPGRLSHIRCPTDTKTLDVIAGYRWCDPRAGQLLQRRSGISSALGRSCMASPPEILSLLEQTLKHTVGPSLA